MKRTLIVLGVLLFLWIGGSSFWYVCKIRDDCSQQEIIKNDKQNGDMPLIAEPAEVETPAIDSIADVVVKTAEDGDPISESKAFMEKNPTHILYFDFAKNETEITEDDKKFLKMLNVYLINEPDNKVYVRGHSDSNGSAEGNMYSSYQRVLFARKVIEDSGINKDRIQTKSHGDEQPAESNESAEGRAKNRRVEITIKNQ